MTKATDVRFGRRGGGWAGSPGSVLDDVIAAERAGKVSDSSSKVEGSALDDDGEQLVLPWT